MEKIPFYEKLVTLRKELHRHPEISGQEERTSQIIGRFLDELAPDRIITGLGGNGVAAVFSGLADGPRVVVRAELDGLPIPESNNFEHRSIMPGISHKCGHDGHMAIAAGTAMHFSGKRPPEGELVVLFQPAEETGEGACKVVDDPLFGSIQPDFIIALHNLPGYDLHEIILRDGVFAAASEGMIVKLEGKTSHASEPDKGVSPAIAISEILKKLPGLGKDNDDRFTQATIIHVRLGEEAFGTSPGSGVVMATLRASGKEAMKELKQQSLELVHDIAQRENLVVSTGWTEEFPPTINDRQITSIIENVAVRLNLKTSYPEKPFRWSEDFGWFSSRYPGALFGLGAGREHSQLHNPDYDFPDELINSGVRIIDGVCRELLTHKKQ